MLALIINGEKIENEYTLDLNRNSGNTFDFEIESSHNGKKCRWIVSYISDVNSISYEELVLGGIRINVEIEKLVTKRFLILQNIYGDKFTLWITPNDDAIRERTYTFKIGKHSFVNNVFTFNIISKETKYKLDWVITYGGRPLPINAHKSQNKLIVELLEPMMVNYIGEVKIMQYETNTELVLEFKNNEDGTIEFIEQ